MKLAALFSGGKDSTYAMYDAKKSGHTIEAVSYTQLTLPTNREV